MAVPLRAGGEVVGVLGLAYAEPGRTFGPTEIALVERFARLAALALENARLYAALQQSEELHRRIVECSTDLISLVDLEGTIVVISPSVFGTLGFRQEEMVGTVLRASSSIQTTSPRQGRCSPTRCRARSRPRPSVSGTRRQLGPARGDRQRDRRPGRASRSTSSRRGAT